MRRLEGMLSQVPVWPIDLVENKTVGSCLAPLLFLFGFALTTSVCLAGSALVPPTFVFPQDKQGGPPHALELLCREPVRRPALPLATAHGHG